MGKQIFRQKIKKGPTNLLEKASMLLDLVLLDDVLVEKSLSKDLESFVFLFDSKFLGLLVNLDIVDLTSILLFLGDNPRSKPIIGVIGTLCLIIIFAFNDKSTLQVVREILGTSLDSFLRHIDSPLVVLRLRGISIGRQFFGFSIDTFGEFVIGTTISIDIAVMIFRAAVFGRIAVLALSVRFFALLGRADLGSLFTFRWILDDVRRELVAVFDVGALATGLAVTKNGPILLNNQVRLRVLALLAQDKLVDEGVKVFLELGGVMCTVDYVAVIGRIGGDLSTQLKTKEFDNICECELEQISLFIY